MSTDGVSGLVGGTGVGRRREIRSAVEVVSGVPRTTAPTLDETRYDRDEPDIVAPRKQRLDASKLTTSPQKQVPAPRSAGETRASPRKQSIPVVQQTAVELLKPAADGSPSKYTEAMNGFRALRNMASLGLLDPWLGDVVMMKQFEWLSLATDLCLAKQANLHGILTPNVPRLALIVALTVLQRDRAATPEEVRELRSVNLLLGAHVEMVDWSS